MKRPAGVIVSAVFLALISLLQVVMALGMVVAAQIKPGPGLAAAGSGEGAVPPPPAWMPYLMYGTGAFFLGLAAWGILTAIGLHRLRNWARISVLIIGGGMAFFGFFSMLAMLLVMFIPLPSGPGIDPSRAQAVQIGVKAILAVMALFYAIMASVGIWWLVYFNRKNVRALFTNPQGEIVESRRPLLISIFAVMLMIGGPACLLLAFLPFPALIFGMILRGWGKVLFVVAYAPLGTAAGLGLWQLKEWGRRLTLALMAFGVINCFIYLVQPSSFIRMTEEINKSMNLAQPALSEHFQNVMMGLNMALSVILLIAIAYMLHYYRDRFREPTAPPPLVSLPPQPDALDS